MTLIERAHRILDDRLSAGSIAVDATVGNGHDTVFLLRKVQPHGQVFGFDIQPAAIEATRTLAARLELIKHLTLICTSHADMNEHVPEHYHGKVAACMFNLGYLPGSDKTVTTRAPSTMVALNAALRLLAEGGTITVMVYPGHPVGEQETEAVARWCDALDRDRYDVVVMLSEVPRCHAPRLYVIKKIG